MENGSVREDFSDVLRTEIISEKPLTTTILPVIENGSVGENFSDKPETISADIQSKYLIDRETAFFTEYSTYLVGIILIIVLMFMTKRKRLCPTCLNGHYALILPVNFLEERKKRTVFVAVYAIITLDILDMMATNKILGGSMAPYERIFLKMFLVALISIKYLALLRCISITSIVTYLIGLLYSMLIIATSIIEETPNPKLPIGQLVDNLIVRSIIIIVAGLYIIYWFVARIVKLIKKGSSKRNAESDEITYVKSMMKAISEPLTDLHVVTLKNKPKCSTFRKWFRKYIYFEVRGFKYSLTILISLTVGFIAVTKTASKMAVTAVELHLKLKSILDELGNDESFKIPNFVTMIIKRVFKYVDVSEHDEDGIDFLGVIKVQLIVFAVAVLLAVFLSYILSAVLVCRMLVSYRQNVLNMYRRKTDQDILNVSSISNIKLVISGIQFAGYQVAYLISGYGIQVLFMFLFFLVLFEIILFPIQFAFKTFLKVVLHLVLPIVVVLILITGVQYLLVRFAFLENRGKTLALDNRRGFFITMYIVFFYNVFTGFFSCFKRVLKCAMIGIIMVSRLDSSLFPKSFAKYDSGFKAYSCLLYLEALQCNPIVRTFVYILLKTNTLTKFPQNYGDEYVPLTKKITKKRKRSMVARNKWFVAMTLLQNPALVYERKIFLLSVATKSDVVKILINDNVDGQRESIV